MLERGGCAVRGARGARGAARRVQLGNKQMRLLPPQQQTSPAGVHRGQTLPGLGSNCGPGEEHGALQGRVTLNLNDSTTGVPQRPPYMHHICSGKVLVFLSSDWSSYELCWQP